MVRKNRGSNKRRRKGRGNRRNNGGNSNLAQIRTFEMLQTRGTPPVISDPRPIKLKRDKVYTFNRAYVGPIVFFNATVDQSGAIPFRLIDLPDYMDYTALYDAYRIMQATVQFIPTSPNNVGQALYSVVDYDDSSILTSLGSALEYDTLMLTQPGQLHLRTITPRIAFAVFSGAFTSYAQRTHQWLDAGSPSVLHYGLKWYFPSFAGATTAPAYTTIISLVLQCRNTR